MTCMNVDNLCAVKHPVYPYGQCKILQKKKKKRLAADLERKELCTKGCMGGNSVKVKAGCLVKLGRSDLPLLHFA